MRSQGLVVKRRYEKGQLLCIKIKFLLFVKDFHIFHLSALPTGWVLSCRFGHVVQLFGTHIRVWNHLIDFLSSKFYWFVSISTLWSFSHLAHMGFPMGELHRPNKGPLGNTYLSNYCNCFIHIKLIWIGSMSTCALSLFSNMGSLFSDLWALMTLCVVVLWTPCYLAILECPRYQTLRSELIECYYLHSSSMLKLLNSTYTWLSQIPNMATCDPTLLSDIPSLTVPARYS